MKTYKKWMALLLAVMLLAQCVTLPAFGADTEAKIVVSEAAAAPGETAAVTISLENNPGITIMTLVVDFDSTVLTLTEVQDAGVFGETAHKPELVTPYTLVWANDTATENFTVNGTIVTLMFTVNENAALGTVAPVSVSYDLEKDHILDKDLEPVSFAVENGSVTAEEAKGNPIEDFEYELSGTELTITGYVGEDTTVVIDPEYTIDGVTYTVTQIAESAFETNETVTSVVIPETVTAIGDYAFYDCLSLTSVTVLGKETEIGECALGLYYVSRKEDGIVDGFVLKCYENSPAHVYAQDLEMTVELLIDAVVSVTGSVTGQYESVANAIAAASAGDTLKLVKSVQEDVTVNKNLNLDLNGCSIDGTVTVAEGCTLYGLDAQTDDYTVEDAKGYGKITAVAGTGTVAGLPEESTAAENGYLMVTEVDGISFHSVKLQLVAMSLRAGACGLYYKSEFAGDELVADQVTSFGVALNLSGAPEASNMGTGSGYSVFTEFQPGVNEDAKTSTLLKNVLRTTNAELLNFTNANRAIYGRAYIKTDDGYMFGAVASRSFREQVEAVDKLWSGLSDTQKAPVVQMYKTYTELMADWDIPAIKSAAQS